MLEQLTGGDDDVEAAVLERERLVEVGPLGLQASRLRVGERLAVDVDADDLVAVEVRDGEGAVAAAEVEHPPPRDRRRSGGRAWFARAAYTKPRPRSSRLWSAYCALFCSGFATGMESRRG